MDITHIPISKVSKVSVSFLSVGSTCEITCLASLLTQAHIPGSRQRFVSLAKEAGEFPRVDPLLFVACASAVCRLDEQDMVVDV